MKRYYLFLVTLGIAALVTLWRARRDPNPLMSRIREAELDELRNATPDQKGNLWSRDGMLLNAN